VTADQAAPDLVADIGGTNARFAMATVDRSGSVHLAERRSLLAASFGTPLAAVRSYLDQVGACPRSAVFAVAGPVIGGAVRFTNSPWTLDPAELQAALELSFFRLLNDFEALALGLPTLAAADLRPLGGPTLEAGDPQAPLAVLGPGTGLGVGACLRLPGGHRALPGEGGHVALAAADNDEAAVIEAARAAMGPAAGAGPSHVSAEWLLSGPGLPRLHAARLLAAGRPATTHLTAEAIVAAADRDGDADCGATLDLFCALLGTVAGNLAVTVGARGGVFVGGGIAPRIAGRLAAGAFRQRFEAKGPMTAYTAAIPTHLILADDTALRGCAAALSTA